jgi:hypothetical protein
MVEIDYNDDGEKDDEIVEKLEEIGSSTTKKKLVSTLDNRVQDLMKLIGDIKAMNDTLKEFNIDITKMPLGKLSKKQITSGYVVLQDIQDALKNGSKKTDLAELSSEFYSLIPHDFGRKRPQIIDSPQLLKSKLEMLETLGDLEIATKMLSQSKDLDVHPIDSAYGTLKTKLTPVEKDSKEYKLIEKMTYDTHGPTHTDYKLKIVDIFTVEREGESEKYSKSSSIHNKRLLWHGSRTTNFMGILSQGLRIAPPEAPVTGYMFGKGVYFADVVSKSANYCFSQNEGCLLLGEVALGDMYEIEHAEFIDGLKKPYKSTLGRGKNHPNPSDDVILENGTVAHAGKTVSNKSCSKNSSLLYNEYIVYDTSQILLKYMIRVKFDFKK